MPISPNAGNVARLIRGPAEALQHFGKWPEAGGWLFERAKSRCHAALEIEGDVELALQAFIAASLKASIPFA